MSLPKQFSDLAIVLKRVNFGETDKVLTVFTREHGKIAVVAKGVRKTTSRKAPHIEPFTLTKIYLVKTNHLPLVTQAETIESFSKLKLNLDTTQDLFYLGEIVDQLLSEDEINTDIFDRFVQILKELETNQDPNQNSQKIVEFQVFVLQTLGFGLPNQKDAVSLNKYIEQLIDRKIKSNELH